VLSCCVSPVHLSPSFFFFPAPATPAIYTLSLHDALPISRPRVEALQVDAVRDDLNARAASVELMRDLGVAGHHACRTPRAGVQRSEEHTSELQSRGHLVCRLLLEKKKKKMITRECTDTNE